MEVPQANLSPKVLILPKYSSPEARICTLAHPRTLTPSRYYFDPDKGLYEFTRVAAPKPTCRSWLIGRKTRLVARKDGTATKNTKLELAEASDRPISKGYTIKNAEMLIATPIDHLFLLLPAFILQSSAKSSASKRLFLSADDLMENLSENSNHFTHILSHAQTRSAMEQRLGAVCDTVAVGDEEMYRLSDEKLLRELVWKAKTMIAKGLPASMEQQFIRKALEAPLMGIKHEETSVSEVTMSQDDTPTSESIVSEAVGSQASIASGHSTASATSTTTEVTVPEDITPTVDASELYRLLRLRTALSYLIASYVPPVIALSLTTMISSGECQVDFKILDDRLANIAKMRAEAFALRSLGDFSRKRSMYEDDDAAEIRAEKKRKKEEEEKKKKASQSRGIKDLKKVDTKGMKKMSDFFGKAAAAKKK